MENNLFNNSRKLLDCYNLKYILKNFKNKKIPSDDGKADGRSGPSLSNVGFEQLCVSECFLFTSV